MNEYKFEEKAINLVYLEENENEDQNKFIISEEGKIFLKNIEQPLSIISVAGDYRTGKSYLLNKLFLNKGQGFNIGNTTNACTKGIWVWGKPLKGKDKDGNLVNILIIDTEGIGSTEKNVNYDNKIFSLTILLSSLFVYNSIGSIDENSIEKLSLVLNLSKHIHLKSNQDNVAWDDYAEIFPNFIWVVRDFLLELADKNGDPITRKEYLDNSLVEQEGFDEIILSKNKIRKYITTFFKERSWYTLVRPTLDEEDIQNLDSIENNKLRPEFLNEIINLKKFILNNCKIKKINDCNLTGEMLIHLINNNLNAINNGSVPNIEYAWIHMCESNNNNLIEEAKNEFNNTINEEKDGNWPTSENKLIIIFEETVFDIKEKLNQNLIGNNVDSYLEIFENHVKENFEELKENNVRVFKNMFFNFLNQRYENIRIRIKDKTIKNYNDYVKELEEFFNLMIDFEPNGPNKEILLLNFIKEKIIESSYSIIENNQVKQNNNILELKKNIEDTNSVISELKKKKMEEVNTLKIEINSLETENQSLKTKNKCIEDNLVNIKKEKNLIENNHKNRLEESSSELNKLLSDYKSEKDELINKIKDLEDNVNSLKIDYDKEKALYTREIDYFKQNQKDLKCKEEEIIKKLEDEIVELKEKIKEVYSKKDTELNEKEIKISHLNEKLNDRDEDIIKKDNELNLASKEIESSKNIKEVLENNYKEEISELKSKLNNFDINDNTLKKKTETLIEQATLDLENKNLKLVNELKTVNNKLRKCQKDSEKEDEIHKQKISIYEKKIKDLKEKINEEKLVYQKNLTLFSENDNLDSKEKINQHKELYETKIKDLEEDLLKLNKETDEEIKTLKSENYKLNEKNKNLEEEKENLVEEYEKNKKFEKKRYNELKIDYEKYKNDRDDYIDGLTNNHIDKIEELKAENNDLIFQHQQEIGFLEENITELEQNHNNNILKKQNGYNTILDEIKTKHREEINKQKNEITELYEEDLKSKDDKIDSIQYELNNVEINLASLKVYYSEKDSQQTNEIFNLREEIENLNDKNSNLFAKEKEEYEDKILVLNKDFNNCKEDNNNLKIKITSNEAKIYNLNWEVDELKTKLINLETDKIEFIKKKQKEIDELKENLKKKDDINRDIINELNELKSSTSKNIALINQENDFLNIKNKELKEDVLILNNKIDEKLKNQKTELSNEFNTKISKLKEENKNLSEKLEYKKLKQKDMEIENNKNLNTLDIKNKDLNNKINTLNIENSQKINKLNLELNELKDKYESLKENYDSDISKEKEIYNELMLKLKDLDETTMDTISKLEKENGLLIDSNLNLKDDIENKNEEIKKKQEEIDILLNKFKSIKNSNKKNFDEEKNKYIIDKEEKYTNKIQNLKNEYEKTNKKLTEEVNELKNEIETLKIKSSSEIKEKKNKINDLESKIEKLIQEEDKFEQNKNNLRRIYENKMLEKDNLFNKEISNYKNKNKELELKYKENIQKLNKCKNELNRNKTDWNIEKDRIMFQVNNSEAKAIEVQNKLEQYKSKNDKLSHKINSLKNELKVRNTYNMNSQIFNNNNNNSFSTSFIKEKDENFKPNNFLKGSFKDIEKSN